MQQITNTTDLKEDHFFRSKRSKRKTKIQLRDYQEKCLEEIEKNFSKDIRHQLIVLPTGAGKTIVFSELIRRKRLKTLIIAHRLELLDQAKDKLKLVAPDIKAGIFCGPRKELGQQVIIASIQSASKNRELFLKEDFALLIIDEAHHAPARSYLQLIDYLGFKQLDFYRENKAAKQGIILGFTATAKRGDQKALSSVFSKISYELSLEELVKQGFLVRPKGIHVTVDIDLKDVQTVMGDYKKLSLRKVMTSAAARDIVARTVKNFASDRQGIVFSVDIDHAELLKKDILSAGFSCAAIHSKLSMQERKEALKKFEAKELQFLINPMVLTEGFDSPRADCMINAAPTQNRPLYIQKSGRVLRLHPEKKDALLIDFGYVGEEHPLQTAQTLGKYIPLKKVDDKFELLTEQEKKEQRKKEEEDIAIPLVVTNEEKYDPLALKNREEESKKQDSLTEKEKPKNCIKKAPTEEELLELFKFLRGLGVQTFRSPAAKNITHKQVSFIQILCKKMVLNFPAIDLIKQISCKQGIQLINALKERQQNGPPSERQLNYISKNMGLDREEITFLTFSAAKELIAEKQQEEELMY